MWRYNFLHRTSFQVDMAQSRTISDADNNQSKYLYLYSSRWHSSHQNGISNVWESNYIYICIISIYIWLQLYLYLILYLYFQLCVCICIHQNLILGVESTWQTAGWLYLEALPHPLDQVTTSTFWLYGVSSNPKSGRVPYHSCYYSIQRQTNWVMEVRDRTRLTSGDI